MNDNMVKKNYIYNLVYQVFSLITPLVTTPYISRTLREAGVGQYAFSYSIVSIFVLFAGFGFGTYAQREIASLQGDKETQSKVLWEVFLVRIFTVLITLTAYIFLSLSLFNGKLYLSILLILSIHIIAIAFDISFFYQGNEQFSIIVLKNILVKIVGTVLIFVFVKTEKDVWIYALCQALTLFLSNLSLWMSLNKYVCKVPLHSLQLKKHLFPAFRLFLPTIATSIYTVLDKTIIGLLVPGSMILNGVLVSVADVENGYYEQSEKLVKMALIVITSLGTVMIPRNANEIATGNREAFLKNIFKALRFTLFLGIPMVLGMCAIANNLSPWFFGTGYEKVPYLLMMFSPLILIIGLNNVLGLQYLLPQKNDTKYTIAITTGAFVNIVLNLLLVSTFFSYGACIATVLAELTIDIILFSFCAKDIKFLDVVNLGWKYLISGIIMFVFEYLMFNNFESSVLNTFIMIVTGALVYVSVLIILRDTYMINMIKSIRNTRK